MRRCDIWLGKHLFQPPIILICQFARITQYAFYRYVWWAVALAAVWGMQEEAWAWQVFILVFALTMTIKAGMSPNEPVGETRGLRYFFLLVAPVDLVVSILDGKPFALWQTIAILFAEYALTIRTIPPREKRVAKTKRSESSI